MGLRRARPCEREGHVGTLTVRRLHLYGGDACSREGGEVTLRYRTLRSFFQGGTERKCSRSIQSMSGNGTLLLWSGAQGWIALAGSTPIDY